MIYCSYGNIINFSRTNRIHFCYKIRHWNHWANGANDPKIHPFLLRHVDLHLTRECLGWPHSPFQTTARLVDYCTHFHTTTQQSPIGYNETPQELVSGHISSIQCHKIHPKFTPQIHPKTAPSPLPITTPSNTPILRPTPLTTPNDIRIQLAVLPQYTLQTDRPTDRQTDGPGKCSVKWAPRLLCWQRVTH